MYLGLPGLGIGRTGQSGGLLLDPATVTGYRFDLDAARGTTTAAGSKVTDWADQSGAGIVTTVTQATDSKRFVLSSVNGIPVLVGSDGTQQMGSGTNLFASGVARTVFAVLSGTGGSIITFRTAGPYCSLAAQPNPSNPPTYWYVGSDGVSINHQAASLPSMSGPTVIVFTWQAGANIQGMYVNGLPFPVASQIGTTVNLSTSDTGTAGLTIGGRADQASLGWQGNMYRLIAYSGILAESDIVGISRFLGRKYSAPVSSPSKRARIIFDGDSITRGVGASTPYTNYVEGVVAALGGLCDRGNLGVDGASSLSISNRAPREADPLYDAARPTNFYAQLIGTNDIHGTSGSDQVYANRLANANARKTAGFASIEATVIARNDPTWDAGMEANRVALNARILQNEDDFDIVIDYTADSRLETPSPTYLADQLHPNDAGYAVMATIFSDTVRPYLIGTTGGGGATVTSVSPPGGWKLGAGIAVTITGTGFQSGATVKIGGVACTSVVVVSSTTITCVTGALTSAGKKCVEVTNPGASSPAILKNGYRAVYSYGWWDALAGLSLTGSLVDSWTDQSRGLVASQTGSNRPSRLTASLNGLNTVDFSGGKWLDNIVSNCVPTGKPYSVFMVGRHGNGTPFCVRRQAGNSITEAQLFLFSGTYYVYSDGVALNCTIPDASSEVNHVTNPFVATFTNPGVGGALGVRINRTARTVSGGNIITQEAGTTGFYIGSNPAGQTWGGEIAELIVAPGTLSEVRQLAEDYFLQKWAA